MTVTTMTLAKKTTGIEYFIGVDVGLIKTDVLSFTHDFIIKRV